MAHAPPLTGHDDRRTRQLREQVLRGTAGLLWSDGNRNHCADQWDRDLERQPPAGTRGPDRWASGGGPGRWDRLSATDRQGNHLESTTSPQHPLMHRTRVSSTPDKASRSGIWCREL